MSTGKTSSQKRSTRLRETGRHPKPATPVELSGSGQLDARRNHRKPCRSGKMAGTEEVVKNMSSVPCYLQRVEKEDTLQKKALNFGVLDWGTLEKWTYLQKQVANRRVDSSLGSSSNALSSSVLAQRDHSNETRRSKKQQNCRQRLRFPDSGGEDTKGRYDASPSTCDMTKIQIGKSRESGQQIFSDSLRRNEDSLQEQCARIEGVWDHVQETVHKGRISCDFADGEVDRSSFSFTDPSSQVSHSCPFPSTSHSGKSAVSPPLSGKDVAATNTKCKHGKRDVVADGSSGKGQNEVKVPTSLRRELSPHRLLRVGINRIISYVQEGSSANHSGHEEDEVAARGRHSPFKRILNPLLKSKNRSQFSGPIAASCAQETRDTSNSNKIPTRNELEPVKVRCKSSDSSSNPSRVQDAKNAISTKHALLKLAWKNGLPLFILSTNDDNILAATMGKRSIAEKSDFECTYTLFTAHEIRKKCGNIGKGQGNKIKKQGLVYNVVGQMKVSSSKFSTEREFVLFGGKSLLNTELAAIVVKVPGRSSALQSTDCWKSPQMNSLEKSFSSFVAILPSGAHGVSTAGEPSPLIQRWRYGGSCDCGGWDEGCMLKVLTDKAKESSSSAAQSSESCCVELFNQGAGAKERIFTMVGLKEGVYSVELGPSIALLQAFAICIATLHNSTPTILAKLHCSAEARSSQDTTLADYMKMAARKS